MYFFEIKLKKLKTTQLSKKYNTDVVQACKFPKRNSLKRTATRIRFASRPIILDVSLFFAFRFMK